MLSMALRFAMLFTGHMVGSELGLKIVFVLAQKSHDLRRWDFTQMLLMAQGGTYCYRVTWVIGQSHMNCDNHSLLLLRVKAPVSVMISLQIDKCYRLEVQCARTITITAYFRG